jgi:hypothetical protein
VGSLAILLDMDWAPDFVLREVAALLQEHELPATWFVTHETPVLEELRAASGLFELGIHPNFAPGSTHGATPEDVVQHCLALVPEATAVRTHGLVQSTAILELLMLSGLRVDASVFLTHTPVATPVEYVWKGRRLCRVVCCWEDDLEFEREKPMWCLDRLLERTETIALAFHPVHIYLNSDSHRAYGSLKHAAAPLTKVTPEMAEPFIRRSGKGARTALLRVGELAQHRAGLLRDLVAHS